MATKFWTGKAAISLKRLLGLGGKPEQPPPARRPRRPSDEDESVGIESMLKEASGRFAKVQLISLADFRKAIGPDWARLATKVGLIAESVIQRQLGGHHFSGRHGNDLFVIAFRDVAPEEAERRALAIADEIGHRLAGAAFAGLGAEVRVAAANAKDLLQADGTLNTAAVKAVVKVARPVPAKKKAAAPAKGGSPAGKDAEPEAPRPPIATVPDGGEPAGGEPQWADLGAAGALTEGRLVAAPPKEPAENVAAFGATPEDAARREEKISWRPLEGAGPRRDEVRMAPIQHNPTRPAADPAWVPMSGKAADGAAQAAAGPQVALVYRPVWNAATQAFDTHCCLPTLASGGTVARGEDVVAAVGGSTVAVDAAVAARAATQLTEMVRSGRKGTLVVPVRFASLLTTAGLTRVRASLRECADAVRLLHLVIELTGIPVDADVDAVVDAIEPLRPLCRDLLVRAPPLESRLDALLALAPGAVSIELGDVPVADRTPERLARALAELKQAARGFPLALWGARRRAEALAALDAGCAYINGTALLPDLSEPAKARRVSAAQFRAAASAAPAPRPAGRK